MNEVEQKPSVHAYMDGRIRAILRDVADHTCKRQFGTGIAAYVKHQAVMAAAEHLVSGVTIDWTGILDERGRMVPGAGEKFAQDLENQFTSMISTLMRTVENFTREGDKDARIALTLNAVAQYKGGATLEGLNALLSGHVARLAETDIAGKPSLLGGR